MSLSKTAALLKQHNLTFSLKENFMNMSSSNKILPLFSRMPSILQKLGHTKFSSYKASTFLEDLPPTSRQYETTRDPTDWAYVQRALPSEVIPAPIKKDSYPSGWRPQSEDLSNQPYFVKRTKNHMIPCYLRISHLKTKRTTVLRRIQGDIWQLERDIKEFLTPQFFQPVRSQVNEFAGFIRINGDYVNAVKYFLEQKGY